MEANLKSDGLSLETKPPENTMYIQFSVSTGYIQAFPSLVNMKYKMRRRNHVSYSLTFPLACERLRKRGACCGCEGGGTGGRKLSPCRDDIMKCAKTVGPQTQPANSLSLLSKTTRSHIERLGGGGLRWTSVYIYLFSWQYGNGVCLSYLQIDTCLVAQWSGWRYVFFCYHSM